MFVAFDRIGFTLVRIQIYHKEEAKNSRAFIGVVVGLLFLFAAYESFGFWTGNLTKILGRPVTWGGAVAAVIVLVGAFVTFMVINSPKVVDFCCSVEAELKKVAWPAAKQVVNATIVVLVTITLMFLGILFWDRIITKILVWLGLYPG